MRRPYLVILAITLILLNACGRVGVVAHDAGGSTSVMSETEALSTLQGVPMSNIRAARGRTSGVSVAGLLQLIQQLVASGQIKVSSNIRSATTGTVDLTQLNNLFSVLQSGGGTSILGLAQGLVNANGGNAAGASSGLSGILGLLNTLLPIIATVAPQYAGIIQALVVIIPLVQTFITLFRKPKTTTGDSWMPALPSPV